jgi:hypothetical protein
MTDPIKLAIEALERITEAYHDKTNPFHSPIHGDAVLALREIKALTALRSIKPDCRGCMHYWPKRDDMEHFCGRLGCTNYDKFTPMPPICLTKEK